MFNPVAPYRYQLPNLYLSVADIANPDLFTCGGRTWINLDIVRFSEEHCQPSSESAWPACQKTVIEPPLLRAGGVDKICSGWCHMTVTVPPHVDCVFWSLGPLFDASLTVPVVVYPHEVL